MFFGTKKTVNGMGCGVCGGGERERGREGERENGRVGARAKSIAQSAKRIAHSAKSIAHSAKGMEFQNKFNIEQDYLSILVRDVCLWCLVR